MPELDPKTVLKKYRAAKERRAEWESHWRECYEFALPQRGAAGMGGGPGNKRGDKLFDGTAPDAVDQLAAGLLSQLTPPWARWFGLAAGPEISPELREVFGGDLEKACMVLQSHFDGSNFAVEMHQCYLDLVTVGTASLLFEEAPLGSPSAFRFTAVPMGQLVLEESADGRLDTTFRRNGLTLDQLQSRFPGIDPSDDMFRRAKEDSEARFPVIEAVVPEANGYAYMAVLDMEGQGASDPLVLSKGRFERSPFINFRWLKAPGEAYGRSPVMKALPDIKTANKVVELVLKNASIAVTGIWQADDDGVLNPATVKLVPGAIIPKAVGSKGLTPLEAPGRFDVSQIVLESLQGNIRRALLADKLGQVNAPKMTATEVLERSADMARILGATYGRLQSELLSPLISRALAILSRRGEIEDLRIDGRFVELQYRSPLARQQERNEAQNTMLWIEAVKSLGPEVLAGIDKAAVARRLGRAFGVPDGLFSEGPLGGLEATLLEAMQGGPDDEI